MQESGRARRDGAQSTAFLLYQGKGCIKSKECRRKHLLSYFDVVCHSKDPAHLCCDNCSTSCNCGSEDCKPLCYPLAEGDKPARENKCQIFTGNEKTQVKSSCVIFDFVKIETFEVFSLGSKKILSFGVFSYNLLHLQPLKV